jgi:light-regulated signal transduction histidine kinase (bacteriophytochrome)
VVADLEVRVQQADASVDIGPLPVVEADPMQMRQLFQNLIANGLKFARREVSPVVRITSEPADDGWVRICVEDNGIGFEEKYLDRIFTIFQRLHSRDEYEGTGIGLAVCRRIVERHGGEITARSTPGQGSTFIFTLPMPTPAPEPVLPSPDERVVQEVF